MKTREQSSPTNHIKWLIPGIGVKRWLALLVFGIALLGLGVVYVIIILYRSGLIPRELYRLITLQFLPPWSRIAVAITLSLITIYFAIRQLSRLIVIPFIQTGGISLADAVYQRRILERGPQIVSIGGGTGLSSLLRGLKKYTENITAIITVADDGGSSGRLRRELGLPPPGDFRNCIAALADDEALTTQLLQYRFGLYRNDASQARSDLSGHSFGNLFIAAMTGVTGSFEQGVQQSSRVLAIQGQILPSTLADVTLVADVREQSQIRRVAGESHIPKSHGKIERVFLNPENPPAYPAAVRAILTSDLIVLGPGSLYTSILPNLLVRGICQALAAAAAPVIYVCNVATQPGETDGFTVRDHVQALEQHIGPGVIDIVLANNIFPSGDRVGNTKFVSLDEPKGMRFVSGDFIDVQFPWRHDSDKLAKAIISLQD